MSSPLDVAIQIVENAQREASLKNTYHDDSNQTVFRDRMLFADGTITVLELEDGPGLAKRMNARFDYDNSKASLTLTLRDDQAYKIQRAQELTGRVHLNVRLVLWLNSSNEWILMNTVVNDRWAR
jgi:hypothetical protein